MVGIDLLIMPLTSFFFFFTFLTLLIIPNWTEVLSKLS
jgi:hypothetical protein